MNKQIISMLLFLPIAATAQKGFTITGRLSGLKEPAMAYLDYGTVKDSVQIKNNRFEFKGRVSEPVQAFLAVKRASAVKKGGDLKTFWLENSKISITATDGIKNATVTGSVTNRESGEVEALTKPITNIIIRLMDEADTKPPAERRRVLSDSIALLVNRIKIVNRNFAEAHPNSFMGLYVYNTAVLHPYVNPATAEVIFKRFSPRLRSSPLGLRTLEKLEAAKRRETGAMVTNFTQNDLDGKPFTLSSLRGKYVLVDFWASWCKPCRAENPNVVKAYNELKGKNFEIVGVSLDQGKPAWEGAVKADGLPWIHVSDLKGWLNDVAVMYGISSVPQNLLINPEGKIIAKNLRGEALTEKLGELIK